MVRIMTTLLINLRKFYMLLDKRKKEEISEEVSFFLQNWNLVPFFGLNQRYFVLFLSANSKISHINSRNKCVKNFNTNWNGTPCKQRKYAVLFPHAWECSLQEQRRCLATLPFPTCVGVFLSDKRIAT